MEKKSIYDLKLNELIQIDTFTDVRRVPGGWMYEYVYHENSEILSSSCVFVPYNE